MARTPVSDNEQYYPTYRTGEHDISIKEFEIAASVAQSEERVVSNTSAALTLAAATLSSLIFGQAKELFSTSTILIADPVGLAISLTMVAAVTYLVVAHVAALRRNLVYAARKVIVLRVMLGQRYGATSLVLPNWRLEGADIPHAIKMFPGWRMRHLYPFYAVSFASAFAAATVTYAYLVAALGPFTSILGSAVSGDAIVALSVAAFLLWVVGCLIFIRRQLFDDNERTLLLVTRVLAGIIGIKLTGKYEYNIYRAKLAKAELARLQVETRIFEKIAVFREDRTFFEHNGFSIRGMARAIRDRIVYKISSGASTIPQQLARSIFIQTTNHTFRRKLVEICLSLWISSVLDKRDLLIIYLTAIRYERGVIGLAAAMRHFFGDIRESATAAEAFFLIERVSSVTSRFRAAGVSRSLRDALATKTMTSDEVGQTLDLYEQMLKAGKIAPDPQKTPAQLRREVLDDP